MIYFDYYCNILTNNNYIYSMYTHCGDSKIIACFICGRYLFNRMSNAAQRNEAVVIIIISCNYFNYLFII